METRIYYMPRTRLSIMVINKIYEKIGCSIGDIRVTKECIKVPITCAQKDIPRVEKVLYRWGMIGE